MTTRSARRWSASAQSLSAKKRPRLCRSASERGSFPQGSNFSAATSLTFRCAVVIRQNQNQQPTAGCSARRDRTIGEQDPHSCGGFPSCGPYGGAPMSDVDLLILHGKRFWKQSRWAADKGVTTRTAAKHRQQGLPWLEWAGQIWIGPEDEADSFILARVRRPNPPRRRRRQAPPTAEINA